MANSTESTNSGLYTTRNYIPLIARILLAALFLWSGIGKILNPAGTQQYMASHGMPLTGLFLIAAIVIELGGGLSLLLGYKPRIGALALAVFLVVATLIFHTNLSDSIQQIMFLKNLSILGGLLMVMQYGVGNIALRR
ncbi:MAG TPA: DoxX family protein [Allocoleopsis sp.]